MTSERQAVQADERERKLIPKFSENVGRLKVVDFERERLAGKVECEAGGGVVADEVVKAVVLCQKAWCRTVDLLQRW